MNRMPNQSESMNLRTDEQTDRPIHTTLAIDNIIVARAQARARARRPERWTARCKSGYAYRTDRGQWRKQWHTCNQPCRKGMLMCEQCLSAEVVPTLAVERSRVWTGVVDACRLVVGLVGLMWGKGRTVVAEVR